MKNARRVIINTGAQYTRTIINLCLSLYSTRLILSALGNTDYGIFTLIAGIVSLLSFVENALVVTTQRYLSFSMGHNDMARLKEIFNSSLILHIILAVFIALVIEFIGLFLFDGFLNIDPERIEAARNVYHLTTLMLLISFIAAPFRALLIAHENIVYISIIDVLDGIFKLFVAILISNSNFDRLILYVSLLVVIRLFNLLAFSSFDKVKYKECIWPTRRLFSKSYVKEMSSFAGWTIYSVGCIAGRTQGVAIVINKVFGVLVNAAYGIGLQINGAVAFLAQSICNAVNPQIMKAEGAGDRQRMLRLAEIESKFAFFLMSMVLIP